MQEGESTWLKKVQIKCEIIVRKILLHDTIIVRNS